MDVRLSPEQQALRDSVAQVVDRLGPSAVGQLADGERADELDAAIVASGWRELRVAEGDGSPLASGVEAAIVAEELAYGIADAPYVGPTLAAEWRRLAELGPATGLETVALTPDLGGPAASPDGSLPGGAVVIDAGDAVTALVLLHGGPGGHLLAQVPVRRLDQPTDLTRSQAVLLPSSNATVLGGRPLDAVDVARWTALGLALTSADLVGVMRGAVALAVEYACGRRQYGQPIGAFQAVQHMLADAFVLAEGSRSTALYAAWAVDALRPEEAVAAAALAKAYCARAARTVCETSIQVHAGIGNTWECLAHVHLRRALVSTELFGGVGPNLERVLAHNGIGGRDGLR